MSSTDPRVQGLLESNHKISETWTAPPTMEKVRAMALASNGGLVILTCLDPRCVPEQFFGPQLGAGVIRNAGGRATKDAINSITVLRSLVNVSTVLVVHHTDCGITHITDEEVRRDAEARTPDAVAEINATETYGCIGTVDSQKFEETIRQDVLTLRRAKMLAGVEVRGMAVDTFTGTVTEIKDLSL